MLYISWFHGVNLIVAFIHVVLRGICGVENQRSTKLNPIVRVQRPELDFIINLLARGRNIKIGSGGHTLDFRGRGVGRLGRRVSPRGIHSFGCRSDAEILQLPSPVHQ